MHRPARDYQIACVDAVSRCINTGYHDLYYELPTGTGKTRIMTLLVELYRRNGRVLVLAHRKELIEQTAASIRDDIEGVNVGIVMAEKNEVLADVVVGTWQSLTPTRLEQVLECGGEEYYTKLAQEPFSLILIDEAHHAIKDSAYERIIGQVRMHSPHVAVVGATATPFRSDKMSMQDVLPECAFARSITDMQLAGWLAPLKWQAIKLSMDFSKIRSASVDNEKEYNQEDLYRVISPQTAEIVAKTAPHFGMRPTLVFAINVKHAEELARAYNAAGITTMALHAKSADRKGIFDAWMSGAIQCVVNIDVCTEGFDYQPLCPNKNGLGVIVNAAPCMSPSRYLQKLGRGTRLKPTGGDFNDCFVLDVASNANLLETKQIVLPKVLPSLQEDIFEHEDEFIDFDGQLEAELAEKPEAKEKPPTILRINDPLSTSWIAWGYNRVNDIYYCSLSSDKKTGDKYLVSIIPSQKKDGLYKAFMITVIDRHVAYLPVVDRAKPLGQIMHHVNHVIAQNGLKQLVDKRATWRRKEPSTAQLDYLKVKQPAYYRLVMRNHWTQGQVSTILDWLFLKPILKTLVEQERNGNAQNLPSEVQTAAVAD